MNYPRSALNKMCIFLLLLIFLCIITSKKGIQFLSIQVLNLPFWSGESCTKLCCDFHYWFYLLDIYYLAFLRNTNIQNTNQIQADVTFMPISHSSAFTLAWLIRVWNGFQVFKQKAVKKQNIYTLLTCTSCLARSNTDAKSLVCKSFPQIYNKIIKLVSCV